MDVFSKEINRMFEIDQSARRDLSSPPAAEFDRFKYIVYTIDEVHYLQLQQLIKDHSFPNSKTVSPEILDKLHVLILHQDEHSDFQKECAEKCGFSESQKEQILKRIEKD